MMVGSCIRHRNNEMLEFLILGVVKEAGQQDCCLGLPDGSVGDWWLQSVGRQV